LTANNLTWVEVAKSPSELKFVLSDESSNRIQELKKKVVGANEIIIKDKVVQCFSDTMQDHSISAHLNAATIQKKHLYR
jgi:hypothetical protein